MKQRVILVAVLLFLFGVPTPAQWREGGKVVPNKPWAKADGDFGATLVFTDKLDELFAAWEKPSPGVHLSETSTAMRGVPIVGIIYFTGCVANPQGDCELVGRFNTKTPSGKPWGDPIDADLWVDKPAPDKDSLQLSLGNLGIVIDPDDPLGVYKVSAEILDRVSKKKMVLEREFTAVERPTKQ